MARQERCPCQLTHPVHRLCVKESLVQRKGFVDSNGRVARRAHPFLWQSFASSVAVPKMLANWISALSGSTRHLRFAADF